MDTEAFIKQLQEQLARAELEKREARDKQYQAEKKQHSAEQKMDSQFKLKSSLEEASERAKQFKTVDICFVVDCTQSMQPYIDSAKAKITEIAHGVLQMMGHGGSVRFGIIGYRDFDVSNCEHPIIMPFTTDVPASRAFLQSIEAKGGDDWCEDVLTGLEAAVRLDWRSKVRMLYLISQTPNHGSRFHTHNGNKVHSLKSVKIFKYDKFVDTDKQYKFTDDILRSIREHEIHFHCLEISSSTAQMFEVFADQYNDTKSGLILKVHRMNSSADSLLSSVMKASWNSIESSIQRFSNATLAAGVTGPSLIMEIDRGPIDWDNMKGWKEMTVQVYSFEVRANSETEESWEKRIVHCHTRHKVRIAPRPFNRGAMRYAFALFDDTTESKLVAKVYALKGDKYKSKGVLSGDMRTQAVARYFADKFNKRIQHVSPLQFVQAQVIVDVTSGEAGEMMCVEPYIPGEYLKQTNNSSYVGPNSEIGQAFSHFTHDFSCGEIMVTDIQGVLSTLTDPQIHSKQNVFGRGNLGTNGMDAFFMVHRCGDICKSLKLKENPAQINLQLDEMLSSRDLHAQHAPVQLSAYAIRKTAQLALTSSVSADDWIGDLRFAWPTASNHAWKGPMIIDMKRDFLAHVIYEPESYDYDDVMEMKIQDLARHLKTLSQDSGRDWLDEARRIELSRQRDGGKVCRQEILKKGYQLSWLNGKYVHGMDRRSILQLLATFYDDSDTTKNVSLCFIRGSAPFSDCSTSFSHSPCRGESPSPKAKEPQVEAEHQLTWLCGGKCGTMVSRDSLSDRYTGNLPKEVFCTPCTVKVRKSWRAKVCAAEGCKEFVKYHEFVLEVNGGKEPELCASCMEADERDPIMRKSPACSWRAKKCHTCKIQIDYSKGDKTVPDFCQLCIAEGPKTECDEGPETECDEAEWEWVPEDYSSYKKSAIQTDVSQTSCKTCYQCQKQFEHAGTTYVCQSNEHTFTICGSPQCQKKLAKKGEDLCKRSGRFGQQKLEFAFAKGRGSCCPECMLLLKPMAKHDCDNLNQGPTSNGRPSVVSSDIA